MDIVYLRHTVRQIAHTSALPTHRQAQITVAISALAQAFLRDHGAAEFTVLIGEQPRPMLEVRAIASGQQRRRANEHLQHMLSLRPVHRLVDELSLTRQDSLACLTIRMGL
jgi:hypothetical protein